MTGDINAADLPEGSVVVDDGRHIVWVATPQPGRRESGRWAVSGSPSRVHDHEIDAAMRYTARVLREGY